MPNTEPRVITRARPSLSCVTCRRRKVRCLKEQPACSNCVRMSDRCEYDDDTHNVPDPRTKRKRATTDISASINRHPDSRSGPAPQEQEQDWVERTERPQDRLVSTTDSIEYFEQSTNCVTSTPSPHPRREGGVPTHRPPTIPLLVSPGEQYRPNGHFFSTSIFGRSNRRQSYWR